MKKFSEWMKNNHKVQRGVAGELKIAPSTLHDILKNGLIPNLRLAFEIEKYTRGDITLYDWVDQPIPQRKASHIAKNKKEDKKINKSPQ